MEPSPGRDALRHLSCPAYPVRAPACAGGARSAGIAAAERKVRRAAAFVPVMPILLALLVAALAVPAAASAAPSPDRAALLSAASPAFAWEGDRAQAAAPQQSAEGYDPNRCTKNSDYYCDITLVRLDAAGGTTADLEFAISDFSVSFADFDLSIFTSDASGAPGELIANGGNLSAAGMEETVTVPAAEPGYYLVTVSYYFSPDATFKGSMKATGIVAPPVPAAPAAAPQTAGPAAGRPAPLPVAVASVRRAGRVVVVRLRAGAALSNVTLALRDRRGRIVAGARVASLRAGTRAVRLRGRRPVRPGRFELVVIGVASGDKRTASFSVRVRG
jgi:hypothetical protein